jgi:hypothetical protein
VSPRLVAVENSNDSESTFKNDPVARLWANAQDRETGAEAVVAIRARRQQVEPVAEQKVGRLQRFLRGTIRS